MSAGVMGKSWGKPSVLRNDREPMFGNGLVMVEGDDWVRHRRLINPAFSPANLKVLFFLYINPDHIKISYLYKIKMQCKLVSSVENN